MGEGETNPPSLISQGQQMAYTISVSMTGAKVQGELFEIKRPQVQGTDEHSPINQMKAQVPTPWEKFITDRSLNFSDFCRDSVACAYENGKRAPLTDLQSRWYFVEYWRKKVWGRGNS